MRYFDSIVAGRNVLKFLTTIMLLWIMILLYMGMHLYQLVEESQKTTLQLDTVRRESEFLRQENIDLRKETNIRMIRALSDDLDDPLDTSLNAFNGSKTDSNSINDNSRRRTPSILYEKTRRRVENNVREMQYTVAEKLRQLKMILGDDFFNDKLSRFREDVLELSGITMNDLEELRDMDGLKEYRAKSHKKLSEEVQGRIYRLQNPENCKTARRLVCSLNKGCGYGCQIHHVIYCMIVAYASNRTMIMNSAGWRYSRKGWETAFMPLSETCRNVGFGKVYWGKPYNTNALIAHLPIIDSIFPRPPQLPQAVPRDLVNRILGFNESPFLWWIGQLCAYLFRYQPAMRQKLENHKRMLGYESPIVGLHVRRTDKIGIEASYHAIDEYMKWAELYYDRLELKTEVKQRRVFIATDDMNTVNEAQRKYPNYTFINDKKATKLAGLDHRYTEDSLYGVIADIHLLSESDYLICTFSSQVCRLAYEIMNSKNVDASRNFKSLDDIYYFGGQNEHKVRAVYPHKARNSLEIDLKVGDELAIAGNHWDGYSKAFSHREREEGIFPSYKVEEVVDLADFPIY